VFAQVVPSDGGDDAIGGAHVMMEELPVLHIEALVAQGFGRWLQDEDRTLVDRLERNRQELPVERVLGQIRLELEAARYVVDAPSRRLRRGVPGLAR